MYLHVSANQENVLLYIAKQTDLEIESFVHGALCYCYSGQCLYSSLIGGRSGNRGQCAQPCRLPYKINEDKIPQYILSLKDICTLEYIPEIYDDERITFSNALPVGTKITLVNLTDSSNPTYWYYSVGSAVTSVKLKDFVSMGKTGSDKYEAPDDIDIINEKLLVVVDFAQCTSCLSAGSYNIKLELTGKNNDVENFA